MNILITGNMGYLGPVVAKHLKSRNKQIKLAGFDTGFFSHALTGAELLPETLYEKQIFGDIRDIQPWHLEGIDAIVHLAAISNDPMGNEFENVTFEINMDATKNLIKIASESKVKNFTFASSCSMYGQSDGAPRKESDPTAPLTAYAKSKIGVEQAAMNSDLKEMVFTSLRFATACGMSDRLRLDLALNDFVACAITNSEISVLSDGSPWRPLIDVEDMARAIYWAIGRHSDNGGQYLAINIGKNKNNYQVIDIANAVAKSIMGTKISINKNGAPDRRSYMVDFSLFESLAPEYTPQISLEDSILQLRNGLQAINFNDKNFRNSQYMRLNTLKYHIANNRLNQNLRWLNH